MYLKRFAHLVYSRCLKKESKVWRLEIASTSQDLEEIFQYLLEMPRPLSQWLLFSPTPEKVVWRCNDAQDFKTFQERLVYKYHIFEMNKNCRAEFGKHHFLTSATSSQTHIEANVEFHPKTHLIPNDFSIGVVSDDKLEKMFKLVETQEEEAPKTIRKAEKIIKKMEADINGYKFVGNEQLQPFWNAFLHIIFTVVVGLGGLLILYLLVQHYLMKSELAIISKKALLTLLTKLWHIFIVHKID